MAKRFTTYSGSDIVVTVTPNDHDRTPVVLGELMAISYSVNRQKFPVRVLGSAPILAYTKGPRTVAGTLVFSVFDQHALAELMNHDNIPMSKAGLLERLEETTGQTTGREINNAVQGDVLFEGVNLGNKQLAAANEGYTQSFAVHTVDDIPPFDVLITFANEYGSTSALKILGVELVDDGTVMSIQDLITQNTISYVARDIVLLTTTRKDEKGNSFDMPAQAKFRQ